MNKVALFSVVYEGAEPFVDDFFESVKNQSYKEFDLIIVNDGYKCKKFSSIYQELRIFEIEGDSTISGNRAIGLNYAIEKGYDYIFLCDIDDYLHPCRVEHVLNVFDGNDIIVNDIDIVDTKRKTILKAYFQKSINESTTLDREFIKEKNIFGFSNTAIRVSSLTKVEFPKDLKIVDWYYFTQLLNIGLKAKFLSESLTEYRQHSGNMIGISSFTVNIFRKLLILKKKHYLYFYDNKEYQGLYNQMIKLEAESDKNIELIIQKNSQNIPYPMWWQNVKF